MSKSKVNAVLKAHGLYFIRYQSSDFHHKAPVVIDQFTKKRTKGLDAGYQQIVIVPQYRTVDK